MKSIYSCFIGLALATNGLADHATDDQLKPLKVFFLAGQSNMQGYGIISASKEEDLDHAAKNDFKYLKDAEGNWAERKDVWYYEKDGDRVCNLKINLGATSAKISESRTSRSSSPPVAWEAKVVQSPSPRSRRQPRSTIAMRWTPFASAVTG